MSDQRWAGHYSPSQGFPAADRLTQDSEEHPEKNAEADSEPWRLHGAEGMPLSPDPAVGLNDNGRHWHHIHDTDQLLSAWAFLGRTCISSSILMPVMPPDLSGLRVQGQPAVPLGVQTEVSPGVDPLGPHNRNEQHLPRSRGPDTGREVMSLPGGCVIEGETSPSSAGLGWGPGMLGRDHS